MESSDPALRQYLQILKRQVWLVVLVPVVALAAMGAFMAMQEPVHRASMTLVVGEARGGLLPPVLGGDAVTLTLTSLLEGDLLARSVIRNLDLDMSTRDFQKKLKVGVLPDTAVLDVSYESTDRQLALRVLSEVTRLFRQQVAETLGVRAGEQKKARPGSFDLVVRVFDPPHVQPEPVEQHTTRNLFIAGIAGLALGLLLAVGRDSLSNRVSSRKDAEEWFNAPVVGALPKMRTRVPPGVSTTPPSVPGSQDRGVASLDLLRARLELSEAGLAGPAIVVTSATAEVGKSTVAANLAAVLALAGNRVVCVDADMHKPSLHELFGLENGAPGLLDVIERGVEVDKVLVPIEVAQPWLNSSGQLEMLPSGGSPLISGSTLRVDAVESLTKELRARADYIVFDGPPLTVADAYALARQADSVLVVARQGRTTKDQAESVRATLRELGVKKVGVVLTNARESDGYYGSA